MSETLMLALTSISSDDVMLALTNGESIERDNMMCVMLAPHQWRSIERDIIS